MTLIAINSRRGYEERRAHTHTHIYTLLGLFRDIVKGAWWLSVFRLCPHMAKTSFNAFYIYESIEEVVGMEDGIGRQNLKLAFFIFGWLTFTFIFPSFLFPIYFSSFQSFPFLLPKTIFLPWYAIYISFLFLLFSFFLSFSFYFKLCQRGL